MDIYDEELLDLWQNLKNNSVNFIMVGGIATNLHGYSRTTGDVDVWIEDSFENRKNLLLSLKNIGLDYIEDLQNYDFIPGWTTFKTLSGMELDIMTYLKGFPQSRFAACLSMASIAKIFDIEVPFLHINQLIEAKKATNRNKDKIDIEELEKIRNSRAI
jgi:hypothetical protein